MTGAAEAKERLFPDLDGDDTGVTELESLCMNCHEQGQTRLLLTLIPHFREVIISSFTCEQCGFEDRTTQSGGRIQDKGVRYEVTIQNEKDFDRQVVKSEWATVSLPDVDFEQPPSRRGEVNTVEGVITLINEGLVALQPARREQIPETAAKIDDFIVKLTRLKLLDDPFTLIIDDPSGNSYVENPFVPETDPAMKVTHYTRSRPHDIALGLVAEEEEEEEESGEGNEPVKEEEKEENLRQEVLGFETNCSECNSPCETNMKVVDVPFFKECIIMATVCDACGFRDNEVKAGSGIEPKGKRITLRLTDVSDLSRDVLKSDTCTVKIPELDFELIAGTLGGRFTTVEGLLQNIKDQLSAKNPFLVGDSADDGVASRLQAFCEKLQKVIDGETLDVHLVLDDPAGNSYLQNLYAPEKDPEMVEEEYVRSNEQNEELGLNDMRTDNYDATS